MKTQEALPFAVLQSCIRQKHLFGENRETAGAVCRNMAESLETDYADNHGNHESQGLNLSEFSIKISSDEKNILFQM